MLTVKHIMPSGDEAIYPAREVRKSPAQPGTIAVNGDAEAMWIDPPSGETKCLGSWGSFYVMNAEGKTVAKYDFGGWGAPAGEAGVTGVAAAKPPNYAAQQIDAAGFNRGI